MWLLIVFTVSLVGVLTLFFVKIREIKTGRQSFVGRIISLGDPYIAKINNYFKKVLSHHSDRAFFLFLVHIPNQAEVFFKRLKNKAHDYYHEVNTKVRGKRDFSDGSVSPYMRSMSLRRDGDGRRF